MRILCVCEGGNCRSVTLATLLKYAFKGNHDALAMSHAKNTVSTRMMLYKWADQILTVDEEIDEAVRHEIVALVVFPPVTLLPIGPDKWGHSMDSLLVPIAHMLLCAAGYEPKETAEQAVERGNKYVRRREATA
jgi:hypothetical protein